MKRIVSAVLLIALLGCTIFALNKVDAAPVNSAQYHTKKSQ